MGAGDTVAAAIRSTGKVLRDLQKPRVRLCRAGFGGTAVANVRLKGARALALALALSLPLAGCGRKAPLSGPPDASVPTLPPGAAGSAAAGAAPGRVQAQGAPSALRKSFVLDPLIQ